MPPRRDPAFMSLSAALVLVVLTRAAPGSAAPADAAGRVAGPVVATEDTMHTDVPLVLVRAPRVTLDEILDRVARGEARRDSALGDQSFTATMRVMGNVTGKKPPLLFFETVSKVYQRKPKDSRVIELRHYEYKQKPRKQDDDDDMDADFSPGTGEEIVNFAFRPENRRNFRFSIEDRKLLGDHLLYTLRFEPRSALAVYEPSGRVWVDTKDFVILRQEIEFRQSPVLLFLKSIRHMVIERTRAGEFWVLSRMLVRMEFTVPLPRFGRSCDFGMAFTDYTVNTGLPDSLFAPGSPATSPAGVRVKVGRGKQ